MSSVTVSIFDRPLKSAPAACSRTDIGAVVVFEGVVRAMEDGCLIAGLRYEMYDPMAERVLASLAHEAIEQFGVKEIRVEHSRGFVGAGERSFRLEIASAHRREALDAMDWYIDRMKRDAPIWKSAAFSTGRAALPCDTPEHTLPEVELPS